MFFPVTEEGTLASLTIDFDFRMTQNPLRTTRADGLGVAILDAASYGNGGPGPFPSVTPALGGALGIGFDTFQNGGEPNNNFIKVYANGNFVTQQATPGFDLANGSFNHARISLTRTDGGALLTLTLTPNGGSATDVLSKIFIPGWNLAASRLADQRPDGRGDRRS